MKRAVRVGGAFLKLGLASFGGPVAHLGYFREAFVVRRRWLDETAFADLVGLCQFLPGPASSQVAVAIGLHRAGYAGALAAWLAFTLPSAIVMTAFGYGADAISGRLGMALIHGLQVAAVAVVASAVWGMARTLCPDAPRAAIAAVAAALMLVGGIAELQIVVIVFGALAGLILCRAAAPSISSHSAAPVSRAAGGIALVIFFGLLAGLPVLRAVQPSPLIDFIDAVYRAGALVFGGGHVVLPLLHDAVVDPGWIGEHDFLAGYGFAQAIPGPLFTFAAYLGTVIDPVHSRPVSAAIGLVALFLPGMLILFGALPFWHELRVLPGAQAAMRGINAAVVGILTAALYRPVGAAAILSPLDFVLALAGFAALILRAPPWLAVAGLALVSIGIGYISNS